MNLRQGDRVYVSGTSEELWLANKNVSVSTEAIVEELPRPHAKKVLVTLDWLDGEPDVRTLIRRSRLRSALSGRRPTYA